MSHTNTGSAWLPAVRQNWLNTALPAMNIVPIVTANALPQNVAPPLAPPPRPNALVQAIDARMITFDKLGRKPKPDIPLIKKFSTRLKALRSEMAEVEVAGKAGLSTLDDASADALDANLDKVIAAASAYALKHPDAQAAMADVIRSANDQKLAIAAVHADPALDRVKDHITVAQAIDCKARGIAFADCDFAALNDTKLESVDEKFGAGNANAVSLITFKDGTERVFKPERVSDPSTLSVAKGIGISTVPRNGNRNIATDAISDLLGIGVTPKVSYGLHKSPLTGQTEIGLMMEKAKGKSPNQKISVDLDPGDERSKTVTEIRTAEREIQNGKNRKKNQALIQKLEKELADKGVIRTSADEFKLSYTGRVRPYDRPMSVTAQTKLVTQLNALDWSDVLTGQSDRHGGNYLVDIQGDDVSVMGIDNDVCFGANQPNAVNSKKDVEWRTTPAGLPPIIDKAIFDRLVATDFDRDLKPKLDSLLDAKEVAATKSRVAEAIAHARQLDAGGYVVDNWLTWRSPDTPPKSAAEVLAGAVKTDKYATSSGGLFGRDFAKFCQEDGTL